MTKRNPILQHLVDMGLGDICLPMHPQFSQADLETIVTEVNKL